MLGGCTQVEEETKDKIEASNTGKNISIINKTEEDITFYICDTDFYKKNADITNYYFADIYLKQKAFNIKKNETINFNYTEDFLVGLFYQGKKDSFRVAGDVKNDIEIVYMEQNLHIEGDFDSYFYKL